MKFPLIATLIGAGSAIQMTDEVRQRHRVSDLMRERCKGYDSIAPPSSMLLGLQGDGDGEEADPSLTGPKNIEGSH